jgi:hypothetical protein
VAKLGLDLAAGIRFSSHLFLVESIFWMNIDCLLCSLFLAVIVGDELSAAKGLQH